VILTDDQARQVKTMMEATDALRGRFSVQFANVSVVYAPALLLNPQVAILHTYTTEHFDTAAEFYRQYGIDA